MDEKWGIDFKKFKKNSSKKLIKGGLGFLLSPREEAKEGSIFNNLPAFKKTGNLDNESLSQGPSVGAADHSKDYIDDIPVIPSLDDFVDGSLSNQIMRAPLIGVKQVVSFKDLESDLLRHSAFSSLEEINLQVLMKVLHSESQLEEPDTPWTKDGIFNEMVQGQVRKNAAKCANTFQLVTALPHFSGDFSGV